MVSKSLQQKDQEANYMDVGQLIAVQLAGLRDRSGALEREELLRLLTDYNDGAHPTAEDVDYILKVTGKENAKAISVNDLLFALKVTEKLTPDRVQRQRLFKQLAHKIARG
eukprot:5502931-Amphidinium_carterae.1